MFFDKYSRDYTVLDIETTGLNKDCEILELSAVRIRDRKVAEKFTRLVKPSSGIPVEASSTNHIYYNMVENEESIDKVLPLFVEFIGNDVVVGYNIDQFDMPVVNNWCGKVGLPPLKNCVVDALKLARTRLDYLPSRSLESVAKYYQVPYKNAHRGLMDSMITYHVYEHLVWTPTPDREKSIPTCPKCSAKMKIREGAFGRFFGCPNYPRCKYTQPY